MRFNMAILFTVFSLLLGASAFAKAPQSALDVMTFEDRFTCNQKAPHQSFCDAVQFKAWSADEKKLVSTYLASIRGPRMAFFLETLKTKGITKLHRVTTSASWFTNMSKRRVEFVRDDAKAMLWVNPITNVIGFTDEFFEGIAFVDPYTQLDRKQQSVLHELSHDFDIALGRPSYSEAYRAAAGWIQKDKEAVIQGVDYEKVKEGFHDVIALIKQHRVAEAYRTDRDLGRALGFPTIYGMQDVAESFAEVLSYYYFDPTAETYLSKDLMLYMDNLLMPPQK